MRPSRALLSLISSVVLCIVAWTSDVHALSMTVRSGSSAANTINFASIATGTPGCLTGFSCFKILTWPTGSPTATNASGGSLTFGTGISQIKITTNGGFTSGPIASVSDTGSAAAFAFNGGIFQGSSPTTGQLTIALTHTFLNLTTTNPTFGLLESGAFLQPGGDVRTDSLTMLGAVDGNNIAQISKTVTGASALATSSYSLNLSPTVVVPNPTKGVALTYTWTYKYNNGVNNTTTSGALTSKFSDPHGGSHAGGVGNCEVPSSNPGCSTAGGGAAFLGDPNDPIITGLAAQICPDGCVNIASTPIPEPSSVLLLGLGLLSGGIFFVSRLREEKEREAR